MGRQPAARGEAPRRRTFLPWKRATVWGALAVLGLVLVFGPVAGDAVSEERRHQLQEGRSLEAAAGDASYFSNELGHANQPVAAASGASAAADQDGAVAPVSTSQGQSFSSDNTGDILYQLATNFLLYTALVLISYLVVKLYIESSPDNPLFDENVSYNRMPSTHSGLELTSASVEARRELRRSGSVGGGAPGSSKEPSSSGTLPPRRMSLLNFEEGEKFQTKDQVLRRLAGLAVGLNVTFVTWGILQERILKMEYGEGEFFTYSYGLVFTNRFIGLCFSGAFLFHTRPTWSKAMAYEYSFPAVSNMLSSWCQYEALKYVTFPTQVLSKSFKIAPIMVMGKLLGDKSYPLYDYVVAGLIALGCTLFVQSSEGVSLTTDGFGQPDDAGGGNFACGIMLILLFLVFDSFTSQWQSRMFTKHRDLSPLQMMFVMNAFSTVFSLVTLVHANELMPFFEFVGNHPEIHLHFIAFSACSTIGQLLIFHTIRNFGAVVFAIIMTVRIALSILASCLIYNHPVEEQGLMGIIIVFGAVLYRIKRRMESDKSLLKWQGLDDSQAPKLFKEWHEHLDF